jgi:sarcosine oxidase subunit alpha
VSLFANGVRVFGHHHKGGGPAGLSAAIELGKAGVRALLVDDKHRLGGKLILQTHKFR